MWDPSAPPSGQKRLRQGQRYWCITSVFHDFTKYRGQISLEVLSSKEGKKEKATAYLISCRGFGCFYTFLSSSETVQGFKGFIATAQRRAKLCRWCLFMMNYVVECFGSACIKLRAAVTFNFAVFCLEWLTVTIVNGAVAIESVSPRKHYINIRREVGEITQQWPE